MPIRNPFRRAGAPDQIDETQRTAPENGFKDTTVSGAKPMQIKDPIEYKLSGKTRPACAQECMHVPGAASLERALTVKQRSTTVASICP